MSTSKASAKAEQGFLKRVPKGIPTGGQFAENAHPEANVALGIREGDDGLSQYTDAETLLKMAQTSAAYWQNHYGQKGKSVTVDVDDLCQETIARVLKNVRSGRPITDFRQLVNSVAANVTVRSTQTVFRAEDRKAYRDFEARRTAEEYRLNRSLTQQEEDVIAEQVLAEWPDPRHKPSKEFRIATTFDASLDRAIMSDSGEGRTLGSTLVAPQSNGHYIEPDSYMDRAHAQIEETGAAHKAEAKRLAWNAIAERADVPLARPGSLSQRQVTKHRNVLLNYEGGIMQACDDWSMSVDNEATTALFAPFGELSVDDQDKVVTMLEQFGPERAEVMWQSAIGFANNKHTKDTEVKAA